MIKNISVKISSSMFCKDTDNMQLSIKVKLIFVWFTCLFFSFYISETFFSTHSYLGVEKKQFLDENTWED